MKAIIKMSIRWPKELNGKQTIAGSGTYVVVTTNQNKKVLTEKRENFVFRGLKRVSQINTLFCSTEAKMQPV